MFFSAHKSLSRTVILTVTALLAAAMLAGCGAQTPVQTDAATEPVPTETTTAPTQTDAAFYTFTDDTGREIVLEAAPERVAVLFSSFADIWNTAGGEIAVTVGESVERGFADEDAALVDAGAGKYIDRELLVSFEPDFVICSADIAAQAEAADFLNDAGIPCAQFHVESFEEYLSMLKICTDITGNQEAYDTYGLQVQERVEQIRAAIQEKNADSQPNILFIRAGSQYSSTKAKTAEDNFVCSMLKEMGTYNIAENAPILLDGLSFEEVLLSNPDFIFISTMGDEEAAKAYMDSVLTQEEWQQLDAVKSGRYAYLPKELFQFKPNARWDEAYAYLADLLEEGNLS